MEFRHSSNCSEFTSSRWNATATHDEGVIEDSIRVAHSMLLLPITMFSVGRTDTQKGNHEENSFMAVRCPPVTIMRSSRFPGDFACRRMQPYQSIAIHSNVYSSRRRYFRRSIKRDTRCSLTRFSSYLGLRQSSFLDDVDVHFLRQTSKDVFVGS